MGLTGAHRQTSKRRGKRILPQMYRRVMRDAQVNDGTRFTGAHVAKVVWPDAIADGVGGI